MRSKTLLAPATPHGCYEAVYAFGKAQASHPCAVQAFRLQSTLLVPSDVVGVRSR